MAVFTAIASAIVGAFATAGTILGSTLLFDIAVGVIAGGLAFATAKVTGAFDPPDLGPNPGSKIQLAPSTDNKIGVAFGRNHMSGPITDINISNQNQTMHFCITLSEYVDDGVYTINKILKNADTLTFTGANVTSITQQNGGVSTDLANDIRIRVYAGGTASSNQVFPTSGATSAIGMMPHWVNETNYSMEGLVFAMVEIDYDAENGLTGLPALTFDMTNSIKNPGDVLIRYLNNARWGAGLSNAVLDVNSITSTANTAMKGYANELVSYTNNAGASATHPRWEINGYISTFEDCLTNIQKICQASATFFLFDTKQGKFKVIPNQPKASTFELTDDNIVSKMTVSSTELYSLFNAAEIEFADANRRDQTNIVKISTPSGELNPNEPENVIKMRLDLINDNMRAQNLANLDLTQSRKGMVIQAETDFSGMQIDVGDVVSLTNTDFGFSSKDFRVLRHKENMNEGGMISCGLTMLEYEPNVYVTPAVVESDEQSNINIPVIPPVIIPPPSIFNNLTANITNFATTGSGVDSVFTVFKNPATSTYQFAFASTPGTGHAVTDVITISGTELQGIETVNNCTFTVDSINGTGGILTTGNVTGNAIVFSGDIYGNFITKETLGNIAVGGQIEDKPADNVAMSSGTTYNNIIPVRELDFTEGTGLESGDYSFIAGVTPIGQLPGSGVANLAMVANVNINYANGSVQNEFFGIEKLTDALATLEANKKVVIGPGAVSGNVVLQGFTDLATVGGERGYSSMRYDMIKLNKGDIF